MCPAAHCTPCHASDGVLSANSGRKYPKNAVKTKVLKSFARLECRLCGKPPATRTKYSSITPSFRIVSAPPSAGRSRGPALPRWNRDAICAYRADGEPVALHVTHPQGRPSWPPACTSFLAIHGGGVLLPTVVPADSRPLPCPPIGALPRNRLAYARRKTGRNSRLFDGLVFVIPLTPDKIHIIPPVCPIRWDIGWGPRIKSLNGGSEFRLRNSSNSRHKMAARLRSQENRPRPPAFHRLSFRYIPDSG